MLPEEALCSVSDFFSRGPILASKHNYGPSHPCSRKYSVCWWQVSKIKNLYHTTDFRWLPIYSDSISNYALHDFTLIKMISAHLMGTGSLLIGYSNGYTKQTYRQLKKFLNYF